MTKVRRWRQLATGRIYPAITVRVEFVLDMNGLIDGVCSKYVRHFIEGDTALPKRLSQAEILEVVRWEYREYGEGATWTWCDGETSFDTEEMREWARGLIIKAFPEMGEGR